MRKLFAVAFLGIFIVGCGMLHEPEIKAPAVRRADDLKSCDYPSVAELTDPKKISQAHVNKAIDCLDSQLTSGFNKVHGRIAGELSLDELRTLHDSGLLTVELESEQNWEALRGVLSLVHPAGRSAVTETTTKKMIGWLRKYADTWVRLVRVDWKADRLAVDWPLIATVLDMVEGGLEFLSPVGKMTLLQAQDLALTIIAKAEKTKISFDEADTRNRIKAIWILKALILESPQGPLADGDLFASSLRKILSMGVNVARRAKYSILWGTQNFYPQDVPMGLAGEWESAAQGLRDYLTASLFTEIETEPLHWAVRKLSPKSGLAELAPDLVRVGQRLAPVPHHSGLHSGALVPLLETFRGIAEDIKNSAPTFGVCETQWIAFCSVPLRAVYKNHPQLKYVALKGPFDWWYLGQSPVFPSSPPVPTPKPLDYPLRWSVAMERFIERGFISKLFETFDRDKDGKIPFEGSTSKDVRDAFDLASTFLRFISVDRGGSKGDTEEEEFVPALILVKPKALYRTIGLIGDRWMPDGNADGSLDANEFFSVAKVYQDINDVARKTSWNLDIPKYTTAPKLDYWNIPGEPIYSRRQFVWNLHLGYKQMMPSLFEAMVDLGENNRTSLFHALIGVPDEPIEVFPVPLWGAPVSPSLIRLRQYVRTDATLAPAAILSLLNRLMILCDRNEDGLLDWGDLDCAMPLIIEGALQAVSSELVDLDPIVHDGSKLLLSFLSMKGMPQTIAKMVAINGSFREMHLESPLFEWIEQAIEADWNKIATFVGAPEGAGVPVSRREPWVAEARRRYGKCDKDHNEKLSGTEMDCFVDQVILQVIHMVERLAASSFSPAVVETLIGLLKESSAVRAGIKLATQSKSELDVIFPKLPQNTSSPKKILQILEESIRRSVPLCQAPDC